MGRSKNKSNAKLNFSRISVLLMYINIIGMFLYVAMTKDYPPTSFIVAWFGFWSVQAIVTCTLQINKRKHNANISFWDAALPYLNEDNICALAERYLDITPVYKKAKVVEKLEEECENE